MNVDFSGPNPDPLRSRRPAQVPMQVSKRGTPKNIFFIFPLLACLTWKQLQVGTDMLIIATITDDVLFVVSTLITLNDLELPK